MIEIKVPSAKTQYLAALTGITLPHLLCEWWFYYHSHQLRAVLVPCNQKVLLYHRKFVNAV